MKKLFFSVALAFILSSSFSQNSQALTAQKLEAKEQNFDFGKIPQGKPVYHPFVFTNTGDETIVIENVQTSCGCTTPEWNKEAIAPGKSTIVKVGYNAAAEGPFEKNITVTYNGNQSKQVIIKGIVWKAPANSAPANASIQLLNKKSI